jgi:hypothetical protein
MDLRRILFSSVSAARHRYIIFRFRATAPRQSSVSALKRRTMASPVGSVANEAGFRLLRSRIFTGAFLVTNLHDDLDQLADKIPQRASFTCSVISRRTFLGGWFAANSIDHSQRP